MRRKIGRIRIIVGAVLLLAALSLFCYNRWVSEQAWESSNSVLTVMDSQIEQNTDALPSYDAESYVQGDIPEQKTEMDTIEVDEYLYIGTLSIPRLGLELPVMDEWSYPGLVDCTGTIYRFRMDR